MSLFKARDWWYTDFGSQEGFDNSCLCVGNPVNEEEGSNKIVVGSHSGILRVFNPNQGQQEKNGSSTSFCPEDLLIESELNYPILQVALGKFVSGSEQEYIAVLHPRKLSVYNLTSNTGQVDHGTHFLLSLVYEHNLQRSAYSLVTGPFGGVKGRDFLCVQSIDGTVSFFEQESFAFTRFLPGFLLPGPLVYVAKTDSFVTVSTGLQLESFRFQVLAVAKEAGSKEDAEAIVKGKKVVADWSVSVGEQALDMAVADYPNAPVTIYILGERNIFAFKPSGVLRFVNRLDYTPCSFLPYPSSTEGNHMLLVTTYSSTLLVYQDVTLKWAAQLPFTPVSMERATFQNLQGMLVLLSGQGNLNCCYLGTDPSLFVAPVPEVREISFKEAEHELNELRKIIKSTINSFPGSSKIENDLKITIIPNSHPDVPQTIENEDHSEMPSENVIAFPTITVKVQLHPSSPVKDIHVIVYTAKPLVASTSETTITSLSEYHQIAFTVQQDGSALPSSLELKVLAIYINSSGVPRVSQSSVDLPLSLVARPCSPVKTSEFKITVDTNKEVLSPFELFPDYVMDTGAPGIGIEFYQGSQVTVLSSKSAQKYRIQSDCFAALWLPTWELVRRLERHHKKLSKEDAFKCSYTSSLPVQEYFQVIDEHFQARQERKNVEELLAQRASQFRVVQKRVLTKLKDKTPAPLNSLDSLLDVTQKELLSLADAAVEKSQYLDHCNSSLSSATQLMVLLLSLSAQLSDDERNLLQSAVSVSTNTSFDEGWEEKVDAAICYILKTCLKKEGKDSPPIPSELIFPKDLVKFKKVFSVFIDRISKGGKVSFNDIKKGKGDEKSDRDDETEIPTGSKFGGKAEEEKENALDITQNRNITLSPIPGSPENKPADGENSQTASDDLDNWMSQESAESEDTSPL